MFVVLNELVALEHAVEVVEMDEMHEQMEHVDLVEMVETVRIDDKLFMHICMEHQKQFV